VSAQPAASPDSPIQRLVRPSALPLGPFAPLAADLTILARPKLALLGLIVTAQAYALAAPTPFDLPRFGLLLAGAWQAQCGASALNQWWERERDARMRRTAGRPLPAGRIRPGPAALYGLVLVATGLALLWFAAPLSAVAGAIGVASYLLLYTPLKARSSIAILVGSLPGAVPVLMGWSAASGTLDARAWTLFAILFLWQVPHFLAIAWMYRVDYARAGFRMLTEGDHDGSVAARHALVGSALLTAVSLAPTAMGWTGLIYTLAAIGLGAFLLRSAASLVTHGTSSTARGLLRASVIYMPALLAAMMLDVLIGGLEVSNW